MNNTFLIVAPYFVTLTQNCVAAVLLVLMTFAKLTSFLTKNTKSNLLFVYETLACFWNIWALQH